MSKNTGTNYEQLTQEIFQSILNQSAVNNIRVERDVTLQGVTAKHQIDVFWEFGLNEFVYRTIVQCKDWAQPVDQGKILQLKAILNDIPGQPTGIFVTKTGYQEGALEVAKANGIKLYELREPTAKDMEGKVMTVQLRISMFVPTSTDAKPMFDQAWAVEERQRRGLAPSENIEISAGGFEDQLFLLNEAGDKVGTFRSVIQTMFPAAYVELPVTVKEHLFTAPTYMLTGNARFPRIKLRGIRATVSVLREDRESILKGEDFIGFVLRDVIGDKTRLIDKQKRPIK